MFVEPRPENLIARVCESLDRTTLGDPTAGNPQRQLKAALFALRLVQSDVGRRASELARDVDEMRSVLLGLRHPLPQLQPRGSIEQEHLALQEQLSELEETVDGAKQRELQVQLRCLHINMLMRQLNR